MIVMRCLLPPTASTATTVATTVATVTSVRPAFRDVTLAPEAYTARAPVAGNDFDFNAIDKHAASALQFVTSQQKRTSKRTSQI